MSYSNISMQNLEEVKKSLDSKTLRVCVVGIGRIGLPTALSFAKSGLTTIGVDINESLVEMINHDNFPLKDEPGYEEIFHNVISEKKFSATTKIQEGVSNSNLILLSLPTPMDENNVPDYSALKSVASQLSQFLKPNSLVIVESTIEPGFIEDEMISMIANNDKLTVDDLSLDPQIVEKIFKFASIKHILNNNQNSQNKIFELLEEISKDLKNYDLEFRIEELESKFSKDMSESTFNEIMSIMSNELI